MNDRENDLNTYEESASNLSSGGRHPRFNRLRDTISDKLRDTAEAIQDTAKPTDPNQDSPLHGFLHSASDLLNRAADYVQSIDVERLNRDIQGQVRRSPGRALLIAGAAGLFLGVLLRRRR